MVAFGAVKKQQFKLLETGEYVFTLNDIGDITGDYGERMQWDWLVALREDPTGYIARADGKEHVLRMFTDVDIVIGSRQHEWIQALTGRPLSEGDEPPAVDDLLGKRMVGYLTHYVPKRGKNAGVAREDIVAGSCKSYSLPTSKRNGAAAPPMEVPPADDDIDRAALIAEIKKQIRRAALADIEAAEDWKQIDLDAVSTDELHTALDQIRDAIKTVQEA